MEVIITKQFGKDVEKELNKALRHQLADIIVALQTTEDLRSFPNIKKMKGFKTAFRIKMGEYRIGFLLDKNTIRLSRILNRKEIYRFFP